MNEQTDKSTNQSIRTTLLVSVRLLKSGVVPEITEDVVVAIKQPAVELDKGS